MKIRYPHNATPGYGHAGAYPVVSRRGRDGYVCVAVLDQIPDSGAVGRDHLGKVVAPAVCLVGILPVNFNYLRVFCQVHVSPSLRWNIFVPGSYCAKRICGFSFWPRASRPLFSCPLN